MGEKAHIFEARYLRGNCRCICGGYKWEGRANYPGRSAGLPLATGVVRRWDRRAEVSRSRSGFVAGN